MIRFFLCVASVVLAASPVAGQWRVVEQLPAQRYKALNVDTPPSSERRPPIIFSVSFVDDTNGWAACDDGTVLRTTDSGATWRHRKIVPAVNTRPVLFFHWIGICALRNGTVFVTAALDSSNVILQSSDLARTWNVIQRDDRTSFQSMCFVDDRNGWVGGATETHDGLAVGSVFATRDGGHTWNLQYVGDDKSEYLYDVRFADARTGWAVGAREVVHTVDGGATWQVQTVPGDAYLFGVDVISPTEAWVVGSDGSMLHTVDGGGTWLQSKLPPQYDSTWLNSVRFVDPLRGWVVGNDGLIFGTVDGGATWHLESKAHSSYLRGIAATRRFVYTFGNDGVILRRPVDQVVPRQPN